MSDISPMITDSKRSLKRAVSRNWASSGIKFMRASLTLQILSVESWVSCGMMFLSNSSCPMTSVRVLRCYIKIILTSVAWSFSRVATTGTI